MPCRNNARITPTTRVRWAENEPSNMNEFGFPKSVRLLKSSEFERVFRTRCSASDRLIILYAARSELDYPRLGLTVSRKVGNAVFRNQWKRAIREAFRKVQHGLPRGLDLVILPRPGAKPDTGQLEMSLQTLATKVSGKLSSPNAEPRA